MKAMLAESHYYIQNCMLLYEVQHVLLSLSEIQIGLIHGNFNDAQKHHIGQAMSMFLFWFAQLQILF